MPVRVGVGEDRVTPVLSGAEVFRLVDELGVPLSLVILELREAQAAFDCYGFCRAAFASANHSYGKVLSMLREDQPDSMPDEVLVRLVQRALVDDEKERRTHAEV